MNTHVKIIAWLYIILGALGLLGGAIAMLFIVGGGLISQDQTAITVTTIVGLVIGVLIFVLSVPGIIAGVGLLGHYNWARILTLVLSILNLPAFPTGTLLGAYALYVLLDDETSQLFNRS